MSFIKYYISDTHFGHANIIRLCNRPFENVQEMDETLIKNWNSVVTADDDVYILGDVAGHCNNPEKYINRLRGKKHLIIGNHDGQILKREKSRSLFVSIDNYLKIQDGDKTVILFHYPIIEWDGYYRETIHLYGHVHNSINETTEFMKKRQNCYNVGVDVLDFKPRTLKEIISWRY